MNDKIYIKKQLIELENKLFILAKNKTINSYSDNIIYVVENVDEHNIIDPVNVDNLLKLFHSRKITIQELVNMIYEQRFTISWVDLSILYSQIDETIIRVTLVKINKTDEIIRYHCAINLPLNYKDGEKFDINHLLLSYL
ncbi:hypothetical protein FACS1894179_04060 [Bacteroidia bacterium]|nr:hypothetical protein FACS1894179_04060 [Bacteroidia bacterium]